MPKNEVYEFLRK